MIDICYKHNDLPACIMLDLSTGHVSQATADWIEERIKANDLPGARWTYGWFLYAQDDNEYEPKIPDDLWACMVFAKERGFDWIRFDADGAKIEGLPIHEW